MRFSFWDVAKKSEYKIGFTGLTDGKHEFTFEIGKKFFEQLDYSEIKDAALKVRLVLEKKPTMMIADFEIAGKVNVMCDRCTDYFDMSVNGSSNLIYKFGDEELDDENVVVVFPNETEIDITHPVYEFTCLLLPVRRVHPEGKCNQEMLKSMDKYLMVEEQPAKKARRSGKQENESNVSKKEEEEIDPRWAALKQLKNNNKNKK